MPRQDSTERSKPAATGDEAAPRKKRTRRRTSAAVATADGPVGTAADIGPDSSPDAAPAPTRKRVRKTVKREKPEKLEKTAKSRKTAAPSDAAEPATDSDSPSTSSEGRNGKASADSSGETSRKNSGKNSTETSDRTSGGDEEAAPKARRTRRRRSKRTSDAAAAGETASAADAVSASGSTHAPASPERTPAERADAQTEGDGEGGGTRRKRRRRRRRRRGGGEGEGGGGGRPDAGPQAPPEPVEVEACEGVVEIEGPEPRLRRFDNGIVRDDRDPVVPRSLVDRLKLRPLQSIRGSAGRMRGGKRPVVAEIEAIEGLSPEAFLERPTYAELTPLDPAPRMSLEFRGCPPSNRLIDLFCPIGFGTRGLIVAPPKAGKTILLKEIAAGIKQNHPEVELIALLIDERPEEVTDFRRTVPATVLASSNDQEIERHLDLGIAAIERAKRIVETGRDVVVLLDSLTRLGRAFNNSRRFGSGGRTMSGGLDSRALEVPKQLFGAARKAEEGGSLTIIASCLVDTGSRADQIIFEEFKGTGNMELVLDRSISEKRVFPAINLAASGTRKEHLLLTERELKTITALRRRLLNLPPAVQIEQLLNALKRFETNERLVAG